MADNYDGYDGFVVLHGTDTMAYTASLLSFVLENFNKPVCFTGSKVALSEMRNDAQDNLLSALLIAGTFAIPEVVVYFHNTLLRANRTTKVSSNQMAAFDSPNFDWLGQYGVHLDVKWGLLQP